MKIPATVPESNSDMEYRQVVRVETGLYGGMFSRYSKPKMYQKYQSEEMEEKFFVSVLLTHDASTMELPHFTEGFAGIRTKAFYDPGTGMKSTFVAFWEALMNGKMTAAEIVEAAKADELPDLDDKIGQPVRVFITKGQKPDKRGLYANKIDTGRGGFEVVGSVLAPKMVAVFKSIDAHYSTEGLRYLKFPAAVFESDVTDGEAVDDHDDSEIPF